MCPPSSARLAAALLALAAVLAMLGVTGCREREPTADDIARDGWVTAETAKHEVYLRRFLHGTSDIEFFDGWHVVEHDPKTGSAWRWMDRRSITRLRTKPGWARTPTDMIITVYGWVAWEHVGARTLHMEFAVNGHVLDRFEPPKKLFDHSFAVPRWLLENSDWVDLAITVANTARPVGERDISFATTGILWKPAEGK